MRPGQILDLAWGAAIVAATLDAKALSDADRTFTANVSGTGKLSVDFKNMPRGVVATAEGEGLFKKTEVRR
jgi:hypothetical protein